MGVMVQIRNMPEELHRAAKARAALQGKSLSDYLLECVAEALAKPSIEEWRARLATHEPMNLGEETVAIIRADRDSR